MKKESEWTISYENGKLNKITLIDVVGKKQIIEIDEIVMERLIELIDSNIEQSKLMFLTGKNKSYEHSWKHFINKIDYFKSSHNHKGEEK